MKPRGGCKAKFGAQERSVVVVLAYRLRLVALGQVDLDESSMGAFSERLGAYGRPGGISGLTPTAGSCESTSHCLQGMQSQLPPVFSLLQHPIVVPAWQQVA